MKIETYILVHNEEKIMPYLMRHYRQFSDVFILENNCTDRSVEIAESHGAKIRRYDVPDELDDKVFLDIKNNCWKDSNADWVIVGDADEFIYHPEIIKVLQESKATIIQPKLFEMFSEKFPTTDGQIYDEVKTGVPGGPKMHLFKPSEIKEINYGMGCHFAFPEGNIILDEDSGIITLHMRYLSLESVLERTERGHRRMSTFNRNGGWGIHFDWPGEDTIKHFEDHMKASKQVIP
jgi:glycosyltransferase involved in cell wall biosynthesis